MTHGQVDLPYVAPQYLPSAFLGPFLNVRVLWLQYFAGGRGRLCRNSHHLPWLHNRGSSWARESGSLFVNALLQLAMDRQRACYYGEGTNTLFMVWYNFLHQPFSFQIRFRS